jgi:glutaredoxin
VIGLKVILFSTHCPKCNVLESKLKQKNIDYEEVNDVEVMVRKEFTTVPMLEVDGVVYDFKQAVEWIGEQ